ncbi:MAG: T9SS type A sorting domain-containing protein [bacterium]|nr:T9SS type A sorting domain-containing protein [bacterium]
MSAQDTWTWVQTDWSGGNYALADSIDTECSPGELILLNNPDRLVPAFDATDIYAGIWSTVTWRGKLYMAACSTPMSDAGGDIISYDYGSHTTGIDYSVHEEGNVVLRVLDDKLFCPGLDNLDLDWEWGNIYLNEGNGWIRKASIPGALHVHDIMLHDDKLWVTTGAGPPDYRGKLFSSIDMGDSWVEEFSILPIPPENFFRRLYGLTVFEESLFVQSDFWIPEGPVLFEFHGDEMITHMLPEGEYCLSAFAEYRDNLLCLMKTTLGIYDGDNWRDLPVLHPSYNFASRALIIHHDRVYVGGREGAAWTNDLVDWHTIEVAEFGGKGVESFGTLHGRLYAGTVGEGEVYVTPAASVGYLISEPHEFPGAIGGGSLSWDAIEPPDTEVSVQVRSAATSAGLQQAIWRGPDGDSAGRYRNSGGPLATEHRGNIWMQYRIMLTSSDEVLAPVLNSLRVDARELILEFRTMPNPCTGSMQLSLPDAISVDEILVYDPRGRLRRKIRPGSAKVLVWDTCDDLCRPLPSGLYLIALKSLGRISSTQRVILLR